MSPRPKRFAYYARLSPERQRIYRRSDAIGELPLREPEAIRPLVPALRDALSSGERRAVQRASARIIRAMVADLGAPPVELEVLEARPRGDYGELHGLYTFDPAAQPPEPPRIQLWMRTAARADVVAWRSYLRTLLHEVCHHLDYHHLDLEDSLHTQGFYRRESHLFAQIVEEPEEPPPPKRRPPPPKRRPPPRRGQLRLPGI